MNTELDAYVLGVLFRAKLTGSEVYRGSSNLNIVQVRFKCHTFSNQSVV